MTIHISDAMVGFFLGIAFCIVVEVVLWKIAVAWSDKQKKKRHGKK